MDHSIDMSRSMARVTAKPGNFQAFLLADCNRHWMVFLGTFCLLPELICSWRSKICSSIRLGVFWTFRDLKFAERCANFQAAHRRSLRVATPWVVSSWRITVANIVKILCWRVPSTSVVSMMRFLWSMSVANGVGEEFLNAAVGYVGLEDVTDVAVCLASVDFRSSTWTSSIQKTLGRHAKWC